MSEYERPDRSVREPTVEDVRQLMGASTAALRDPAP